MRLDAMLDRCLSLERRAAGLYRRFADAAGPHADLRSVWQRLAGEEDEHAASLAIARATIDPAVGAESRIEGWDELVAAAERVLTQGERFHSPSLDDQLVLALDLERTEIDLLRQVLLELAGHAEGGRDPGGRHVG